MSTEPSDTPAPQVKPFAAFLQEQAKGATHTELSETLRDLATRVVDTGKKGTLTYTVTLEPMKGQPELLIVKDEIKVKAPEHDRPASLFFVDDGNLVRDDPHQPQLPGLLREVVDTATGVIREIPARGAEA